MISPVEPTILVIFGSMGDLTWRKLAPALYNLLLGKQLPDQFAVIGLDIKEESQDEFQLRLRDGAKNFCECAEVDDKTWNKFASNISYLSGDFAVPTTYTALHSQLDAYEKKWGSPANHIFYLATPPSIMEMIVKGLGAAGLADDTRRARIIVEKPFGHDLASAVALNGVLTTVFDETQIYRFDHYLGKEVSSGSGSELMPTMIESSVEQTLECPARQRHRAGRCEERCSTSYPYPFTTFRRQVSP